MDLKYLKSVALYLLSAVLSLLLILYILYHLFGGFEIEIETVRPDIVTKTETMTLSGYILRAEQLIYATEEGDISYLVSEGDKAASGASVANVYASGKSTVRNEIMALDARIEILKQSGLGEANTTMDTSLLDQKIAKLYYIIRDKMAAGDIDYALQKRNELLILLNKRDAIVHGGATDYEARIEALEQEKKRLTSNLEAVSETVITPASGYFYSVVDGYETIFSSKEIADLTLTRFQEMKNASPASDTEENGRKAVGKLVTDYVWYVACEVDSESMRFFQTGNQYPVIFPYNADISVDMTLERIVTQTDAEEALLIFSTGMRPENFNYLRVQTVEVARKTYTGYSVPVSAVRMVDGEQGVYILEGTTVEFRYIDPLFEEDGYFIVAKPSDTYGHADRMLDRNDLIIVKGKNLYDGKIIG